MKYLLKSILLVSVLFVTACSETDYLVTITTRYGDMKLVLFDETPLHKAKFLEFAQNGMYDSTTFHRIMKISIIELNVSKDSMGFTMRVN